VLWLRTARSLLLPHHPRDGDMGRGSQLLAQGVLPGVPRSYRALGGHRARGRPSMEEKARRQQITGVVPQSIVKEGDFFTRCV
jgi:hypothetical protein